MTMMGLPYWNDQLGKVDPNVTRLVFNITGAKTNSPAVPNSAQLNFYDALASQSVIDNFLGSPANQFLLAAFDATAMGTDAFGCIVNFQGQVKQLLSATVTTYSGTGGGTVFPLRVAPVSALTASSLTTQAAVSSSGNVALRAILTGLDILTAGQIEVELEWISK